MQDFIKYANKADFAPAYAILSRAAPYTERELLRRIFLYGWCRPVISVATAAQLGLLSIVRYQHEVLQYTSLGPAFMAAIVNGHVSVVEYLDSRVPHLPFAISIAARSNQWDVVRYFIGRGGYDLTTVLIKASQYGRFDIVQRALQGPVNVHSMDNCALRMAAEHGHLSIVSLLLEHGADVHGGNEYALIHASRSGHLKVVQVLIQHGANVTARDSYAMRMAARQGHYLVVQLLIRHGSDVHAHTDQAFRDAVDYNYIDLVKFLVETCDVDPWIHNGYGARWSAIYGHRALVDYFEAYRPNLFKYLSAPKTQPTL